VNFTAQNDQCATAAEIFQCSQKKDIAFTNALILDNRGASKVCGRLEFKAFLIKMIHQLPTPVNILDIPEYRNCEMYDTTKCVKNVRM
jgi:hypothetical protein